MFTVFQMHDIKNRLYITTFLQNRRITDHIDGLHGLRKQTMTGENDEKKYS